MYEQNLSHLPEPTGTINDVAETRRFYDDPDLLRAIGGVAVESAILDEFLREMILSFILGHEIWLLLEGQPTEWLCQTGRLLLKEVDHRFEKYTPKQHERFNELITRIGTLRNLRNTVVHGTWTKYGLIDLWPDDEKAEARPWGGDPREALICSRSRFRKQFQEHYFTVSDVDRLATEIRETVQSLVELVREMQGDRHEFARWSVTSHDVEEESQTERS